MTGFVTGVAKKTAASAAVLALLVLLAIGLAFVPEGAQPADAGEFQLVARDLGVAHPPGYPLYTLAAHLFGRAIRATWPLRNVSYAWNPGWPWAVNAFSMVLAAATLVVVFRAAARLGGTWVAGAVAAVQLAVAPTFAAQALVANIRMATALFTALLLGLTLAWLAGADRDGAPPRRPLVALAFVLALAAGHHPTLAALALPVGLAVVLRRPAVLRDTRLAGACLAAAVAGLAPLAYLPLRAAQGAPLAPADLATAGGLWRHVTAAGFRGDMLAITGARDLGDRLLVLANILTLQFTLPALALIAIGAAWLVARRRAAAVAVVGTVLVVGWLAMTYRAPQTMEYLLPAYVAMAIAAGAGAAVVIHRLRDLPLPPTGGRASGGGGRRGHLAVVAGLVLILAVGLRVAQLHAVAAAVPDLRGVTRIGVESACLPTGSTILANWHYATPLWLAGRRSDVAGDAPYVTATGAPIVYVHPDFATGDPIGLTWRKAAEAAMERGVVMLTNRPRELNDAGVVVEPVPHSPFWRAGVAGRTVAICREEATRSVALDAELQDGERRWSIHQLVVMDHVQGLIVGWKTTAPSSDAAAHVTAFAQLSGAGGVVGQADRPLGAPLGVAGDGSARYDVWLPLQPDRGVGAEDELALVLGLYRSGPDGPQRLSVVRVSADAATVVDGGTAIRAVPPGLSNAYRLSDPPPPPGAIPFGSAMSLLRTTVRRTAAELVVDLAWRADGRPWASDYTVSVQAAAGDGAWRAQHDGTPALGAIPTLKWLPGMVIRDRHRIALPPAAAGHDGPFTVTVGVYDAFSLEPLPVTDGERARQGQGQRAVVYP